MDGLGVSTGSLPAVRGALGRVTYAPQVASVRAARHFVEAVVTGTHLRRLADDAGLLVSELAANAVLHARTDFDVAVDEIDRGLRVSVRDRSTALPVLTAPSATAMSGRGLALVRTLAARWGAGGSSLSGKSVWFELVGGDGPAGEVDAVAGQELSVEELVAAWSDADDEGSTAAALPGTDVVLPELPAAELLQAKEQMDDVLRELQLILLDERTDPSGRSRPRRTLGDVETARQLDSVARAFDDVRRQVRDQVSRAVAAGRSTVALHLVLPPGTGAGAAAYRSAVEAAELLAVEGGLLSAADTLTRHHAVRRAYLDEVIAASEE